jgi:hypothetical protein
MERQMRNVQFSTSAGSWRRKVAAGMALAFAGIMVGFVNIANAQNVSSAAAKVTQCGAAISA